MPINNPLHYDACIIAFGNIKNDARALNIARVLNQMNYRVSIVAFGNDLDKAELLKENIDFFPIKQSIHKRLWRRWLFFIFNFRKLKNDLKSKTYWSEDFYSLYPSIKLQRQFDGKIIYDSREIYSALGPLYKDPIKQKILSFLENKWAGKADSILVSGDLDKTYLEKYFDKKKPVTVVYNYPPYKNVIKNDFLRVNYKIPYSASILLYQGMILKGRGLYKVISSLNFLPDVYFCLLGDGSDIEDLRHFAIDSGLQNRVIFCGKVDYDTLHEITCSADAGVSLIEPISFSYSLALPNKMFEYCMARIPCLTSNLPAMKAIIDQYEIGEYIEHDSKPEDIARKIRLLLTNKDKYKNKCNQAALSLNFGSQMEVIRTIIKTNLEI